MPLLPHPAVPLKTNDRNLAQCRASIRRFPSEIVLATETGVRASSFPTSTRVGQWIAPNDGRESGLDMSAFCWRIKASGPVSSIILNTARFNATLSCRAGCTNNGHKVSRTSLNSPVCAIAISLRRRSVCSGVSEGVGECRSIQKSEALNTIWLLAHHLESNGTAH